MQVGEQVDFLRFLPDSRQHTKAWWLALLSSGPGWIVVGALKFLVGSFLAVYLVHHGVARHEAGDPPRMYAAGFAAIFGPGPLSLALTCVFVALCQIKINVTNAYAGSIAWSNFFSTADALAPRSRRLAGLQCRRGAPRDGARRL